MRVELSQHLYTIAALRIFTSLFLLALLACSPTLDERAIVEWRKHEMVFEKSLAGYRNNDEFDRACIFFEQLTGLRLHLNYSTVGILATPETPQDLVRIRAWYRLHKHRLYWDESTRTVRVRPEK